MATYPGRVISGSIPLISGSKSLAIKLALNKTFYFTNSTFFCKVLGNSITVGSLSKTAGLLSTFSKLQDIPSSQKKYFNNGFSQDSENVYLSKSALGLSSGLNLSLESLFVAMLLQWVSNTKKGDDELIIGELLADGDKQGGYVYFTFQMSFKKLLTVVDENELQPKYTIFPSDF